MAYGVVALVGFLAQMVIGLAPRLLSLSAWLRAFADGGHKGLPPSIHRAASASVQRFVLLAWIAGPPSLAAGLALERLPLVRFSAAALAIAVVFSAFNLWLILRRLRLRPSERPFGDLDQPRAPAGLTPPKACS
jgi:hypothetical protein